MRNQGYRSHLRRGALLASMALCIASASAQNVSAVIHVAPEHVLPGLPVGFEIALTNASSADVTVATLVSLKVSGTAAGIFQVDDDASLEFDPPVRNFVLRANSTRQFIIAADALGGGTPGSAGLVRTACA